LAGLTLLRVLSITSSKISPTTSSNKSSTVMRPTTPPNSLTTIAI